GQGGLSLRAAVWLPTAQAGSFPHLLQNLEASGFGCRLEDFHAAVFAVPGPVKDPSYAAMANIPWVIDLNQAQGLLGAARTFLINDFAAQAYACLTEAVKDAVLLHPGTAEDKSLLSIIGAGTGLGHCSLTPDGRGGYLALPSEAGHAAFPFLTDREQEYQRFLLQETGQPFATGDLVVSGTGLSRLHRFLTGKNLSPPEVAGVLTPRAETTIWFARFYARACRNFALTLLPLAGLYISGGLAIHNRFLVQNEHFLEEFSHCPHYGELLRSIPLFLNINEEIGLWGAAFYGLGSISGLSLGDGNHSGKSA
ncbi:MAG: glucokinase, partial [Pseudomonadota bacterium]